MEAKTYKEMYLEAAEQTAGSYKGYTAGNALSLYVESKYNVNAAAIPAAHNALCEALATLTGSMPVCSSCEY